MIRRLDIGAVVAVLALAATAALGVHETLPPDWSVEAAGPVNQLLVGHVDRFLQVAPAYLGSLVMRAPFMLLAHLAHGHGLAVYRAGAAPCLLAVAGFAAWWSTQMRARGCGPLARGLAAVLCVANPLAIPALEYGHPEELLGAILCIVALLCALRGRAKWAGVVLGLAMVNKPWGVLAVGPVLLALPRMRERALALGSAATVAGSVWIPLAITRADHPAGEALALGASSTGIFHPWQLWWFRGHPIRGTAARAEPHWLDGLGHTLPIALMVPLCLLFARATRHRIATRGPQLLLLLALLFALRCVLDPWDLAYYTVPFLLALVVWETATRHRPPVIALVTTLVSWVLFQEPAHRGLPAYSNGVALAFDLVAAAGLVMMLARLYLPERKWLSAGSAISRADPAPPPLRAAS